jgi:hypothetical protein
MSIALTSSAQAHNARRVIPARTINEARDRDIAGLARSYGVTLKGHGRNLSGPCPRCGGVDRFGVDAHRQLFNCRGCGIHGHGAIDFIRAVEGCSFGEAVERLTGTNQEAFERTGVCHRTAPPNTRRTNQIHGENYEASQHHKAALLWDASHPLTGTPAERYLRAARGIIGPLPTTLRFLPSHGNHHPALIAAFGVPEEIMPGVVRPALHPDTASVHLTLLSDSGRSKAACKRNKIMVGRPLGRPIVIAPPTDLLGLAITEGIEDGLSVHEATGLGVWVAGSAPMMPKIAGAVPNYVDCVTICADADETGQRNAVALWRRLAARGIYSEIVPSAGAAP